LRKEVLEVILKILEFVVFGFVKKEGRREGGDHEGFRQRNDGAIFAPPDTRKEHGGAQSCA
jgi:hypothetical protein